MNKFFLISMIIFVIILIKNKKIDNMTNNKNDYIIVKNNRNDILYYGDAIINIDWDWIYSNYGYDNYYITFPSGKIIPYYYYNHPRYNLYNPAKHYRRHPKMAINKTHNVHKFYNRGKKFRLY